MIVKMSLEEYREKEFAVGSRPHITTLRKRCAAGVYPNAVKEGSMWYLLVNVSTGDQRADKILARLEKSKGLVEGTPSKHTHKKTSSTQ